MRSLRQDETLHYVGGGGGGGCAIHDEGIPSSLNWSIYSIHIRTSTALTEVVNLKDCNQNVCAHFIARVTSNTRRLYGTRILSPIPIFAIFAMPDYYHPAAAMSCRVLASPLPCLKAAPNRTRPDQTDEVDQHLYKKTVET